MINGIAVIDLGGQYAHLIAVRLRDLGCYAEIFDADDIEQISRYKGVIVSGSPNLSAHDEDGGVLTEILELPQPVLGFCFGHQEIAKFYGGKVIRGKPEFGPATLEIIKETDIFPGIPKQSTVFMSHGDTVETLPPGFEEIGISSNQKGNIHHNAAIGCSSLKRYGFQFHPEVDDSEYGDLMLKNFAVDICKVDPRWQSKIFAQTLIEKIQDQVGDKDVFLLASGGVDSTVLGELLKQALSSEKVHLLHVDTGFMRKNESREVASFFKDVDFKLVDASQRFFEALANVYEPEAKRKIIGELFVDILTEEFAKLNLEDGLMAQGTIYPDRIESGGSNKARVIKTHHNQVEIMAEMVRQGKVIEPLGDLYKKEVRQLGLELGVPSRLVNRHPFPGPGLAVRLLANNGKYPPQYTNEVVVDNSRLPDGFSGMVLPIASVGVKADMRSYELPLLIQGGEDFHPDNQCKLLAAVPGLINQMSDINRVVWSPGFKVESFAPACKVMSPKRVELLREVDYLVNKYLVELDLYDHVWQFPVVMLPAVVNGKVSEVVILRPVKTSRGMTVTVPVLPLEFYSGVLQELQQLSQIQLVAIDLTTKPPGTIEWE
ncbi:MAG: glutamine-hydrolyzing GMP synthase [Deltaproteobacteria bacterium]|jgi:GMP synthase (glutamine-hydrolysing)|nr:glutamine-hydrolyzing GMP synthase [Deltaproteobacteria bacterium]